ncbi:MAG: hypothetical protein QM487_02710 [Candidatus Marithrix sp.]
MSIKEILSMEEINFLLAIAISPPPEVAFLESNLKDNLTDDTKYWESFLIEQQEPVNLIKNQPQHINVFSGNDIMKKLGLVDADKNVPNNILEYTN